MAQETIEIIVQIKERKLNNNSRPENGIYCKTLRDLLKTRKWIFIANKYARNKNVRLYKNINTVKW